MKCVRPHQVLLKEIFARPGEVVCQEGSTLVVEDRREARVFTSLLDREGELVQIAFQGCHRMGEDEVFVVGQHPSSCDSRYFGPISASEVRFEVSPAWVIDDLRRMRPAVLDRRTP